MCTYVKSGTHKQVKLIVQLAYLKCTEKIFHFFLLVRGIQYTVKHSDSAVQFSIHQAPMVV